MLDRRRLQGITEVACEFIADYVVPQMIVRSPRVRPGKFVLVDAKRLLQQYRHLTDVDNVRMSASRQERPFACPVLRRLSGSIPATSRNAPMLRIRSSRRTARSRVFPSPQQRPVLPLVLISRAFQARPSNSAPPPRAGAAVGSKSSGFLAISVCVVRINPATDAALRTAL
jgi:hypothetical protein